MGRGICYLVRETIGESFISHEFRTKRLFELVADWLLKVRSPVTNHVNRNSWMTEVKVEIKSNPTRFKVDGFFDYEISVFDKKSERILLKIDVKTEIYNGEISPINSGSNLKHYENKTYVKTRKMLENRLQDWFKNDIGAILVLACCASTDPDHIFWLDQGFMSKGLGLSM